MNFQQKSITLAVVAALSAVASAGPVEFRWSDPTGASRREAAEPRAINASGSLTVMVETGLDRSAIVEVWAGSQRLSTESTAKATGANQFAIGSKQHVGFPVTVPMPATDGTYTIKVIVKNADGRNFSSEDIQVTLDRVAPDVSGSQFYKVSPYGHVEADWIHHLGAAEQSQWGINNVLNATSGTLQVSTGGGVIAENPIIVKNGLAYMGTPNGAYFDAVAAIGSGDAKQYDLKFIVKDDAGNMSSIKFPVYFSSYGNYGVQTNPQVLGVYDPDFGQNLYGLAGFRSYSPGMTIVSGVQTLRVLIGYNKNAFQDLNPIFGAKYTRSGWRGNAVDIGDLRVRECELPTLENQNTYQPELCGLNNETTYITDTVNVSVKYGNPASKSPIVTKMEVLRESDNQPVPDNGWYNRSNPLPQLKARVTVEPRPYVQVFDPGCEILPGQTSCTALLPAPPAVASGGAHVRRLGYEWSPRVYNKANPAMYSWKNYTNWYMDYDNPVIVNLSRSADGFVLTGVEPNEGALWSSVKLKDSYVHLKQGASLVKTIKAESMTRTPSGVKFDFPIDSFDVPEGTYTAEFNFRDNYDNTAVQVMNDVFVDRSAATLSLENEDKPFAGGSFNGLAKLSVVTGEPVASIKATITGGPRNATYSIPLTLAKNNEYRMGFLPIFPGKYDIKVDTIDNNRNKSSITVPVIYDPLIIPIDASLGTKEVIVPKSSLPLKIRGKWPLSTEPFTVDDKVMTGTYNLYIQYLGDNAGVVTIGGQVLSKDSQIVIPYDFTSNLGRVSLPISNPTSADYSGKIYITTDAGDSPVFFGDVKVLDVGLSMTPMAKTDYVAHLEPLEVKFNVNKVKDYCSQFLVFDQSNMKSVLADAPTDQLICALSITQKPTPNFARVGSADTLNLAGDFDSDGTFKFGYKIGFVSQGKFEASTDEKLMEFKASAPQLTGFVDEHKTQVARKVEDVTITGGVSDANDACKARGIYPFADGAEAIVVPKPVCAVKFTLPSGLNVSTQRGKFLVSGKFDKVGQQLITGQPGIYQQNAFLPYGNAISIAMDAVPPTPPTVAMADLKGVRLTDPSKPIYVTVDPEAKTRGIAIGTAHSPASVVVKAGPPATERTQREVRGNTKEWLTPLSVVAPQVWQEYKVPITASYDADPSVTTTKTYTFIARPIDPAIGLKPARVVSTDENASVPVMIGKIVDDQWQMDSTLYGKYGLRLQLEERTKTGGVIENSTVITSDEAIASQGVTPVRVGKLKPGIYQMGATGRLYDNANRPTDFVLKTNSRVLFVQNGSPIDVALDSNTDALRTGSAATLMLRHEPVRTRDIGEIRWFIAKNGTDWQPVVNPVSGKLEDRSGLRLSFGSADNYLVKAVVKNRHDGRSVSETEPFKVTAFNMTPFEIGGDTATYVGVPIKVNLTSKDNKPMSYAWSIINRTDKSVVAQGTSPSFSYTPVDDSDLTIVVKGKDPLAPASAVNAVREESKPIKVAPATLRTPKIVLPKTAIEVGKPYQYTAQIIPTFGRYDTPSATIKGYWTLPNGQTSIDNPLTYTAATLNDSLTYTAFVEGHPQINASTTSKISSWEYSLPEFKVTGKAVSTSVPTDIGFTAVQLETTSSRYSDVTYSYSWSVPPQLSAVQQDGLSIRAKATEAGTYLAKLTVTDSRGNTGTYTSQPVTLAPQPAFAIDVTALPEDRTMQAPTRIVVRGSIASADRGERIAKIETIVNGRTVKTQLDTSTMLDTVDAPSAGTYAVGYRVTTSTGRSYTKTQEVKLLAPSVPDCKIVLTSGNGTTSGMLDAMCTVSNAYVSLYEWYIDGVKQSVTGKRMQPSSSQWPTLKSVRVVAISSKGVRSEATYTK